MIITIIKATAALFAGVIAICAALLGVASGLARGTTDPIERRDANLSALWSFVVFALCVAAIISLTGCSTLYHTCKDGLCR